MSRYNKDLGDFGEVAAENFLSNRGYKIIERNFSVRGGEIDIIAEDGEKLVFVEVKTRTSRYFGYPSEAVNYKKIEHMKKAAEEYLRKNPYDGEVRFDITEVYATVKDGMLFLDTINHIEDIIID